MTGCPFSHGLTKGLAAPGCPFSNQSATVNLSPSPPSKEALTDPATVMRYLHGLAPIFSVRHKEGPSEATLSKRNLPEILLPLKEQLSRSKVIDAAVVKMADSCVSQREFMFNMVHLCQVTLEKSLKKHHKSILEIAKSESEEGEKLRKFLSSFDRRVGAIRPHIGRSGTDDLDRKVNLLKNIIGGGALGTAAYTWRFILVASNLLLEQGRANALTSRLPKVLESVLPMLMALQSGHGDLSHQVDLHLRRKPFETDPHVLSRDSQALLDFDQFYWTLYHPEDFQIMDDKLCFKPETVLALERRVEKAFANGRLDLREPKVGCPGTVLIPPFCKAAIALCSQPLIERLPTLLKLPIDAPSYQLYFDPKPKRKPKELILPTTSNQAT